MSKDLYSVTILLSEYDELRELKKNLEINKITFLTEHKDVWRNGRITDSEAIHSVHYNGYDKAVDDLKRAVNEAEYQKRDIEKKLCTLEQKFDDYGRDCGREKNRAKDLIDELTEVVTSFRLSTWYKIGRYLGFVK